MIIHDYDIGTEPIVSLESFYGKPKSWLKNASSCFPR